METKENSFEHLFTTFNHVQNGVVLLNQQGSCVHANESALAHIGLPLKRFVGLSASQLIPSIFSETEFQQQYFLNVKNNGPLQLSHNLINNSGQQVAITSSVSIIETKFESLLCLVFSKICDESCEQQIKNENPIFENVYKMLERTQRVAKLGSWHLDLIRDKLAWSKVTYDIHELPSNTPVEVKTGINFYAPEHRQAISQCVEEGIHLKKAWDIELQIITTKGNRKWVRAIGNPIVKNEKTIALEGTFQDIHSHKLLELEQEKVVSRLKKMEIISKMGHWELTITPPLVTWSEGLYLLLGLNPSSPAPSLQEYRNWIHPDDQAMFYKALAQNISSRSSFTLVVRAIVNEEIKYLKGEAKPTFDEHGNLVGFFGTTIDITEQKLAEKQLLDSNNSLEKVNEELSQFAYRTSHDLKAPLSSIKGLSKLITMDINSNNVEDAKTNVNHIYEQADKLGKLIEGILELARADLEVNQLETINLLSLVNSIKLDYQYLMEEYNVELIIDIPKNFELTTLRTPIQQIMINLIINGLKYSNPNLTTKFVKVMVLRENETKIFVSDNGIGIPHENIDTVFELFTRLHPQHSDGSGLGLSIVKKHLQTLNGSIHIESDHNGSTFTLTLPTR